jgi:hypothetical protein
VRREMRLDGAEARCGAGAIRVRCWAGGKGTWDVLVTEERAGKGELAERRTGELIAGEGDGWQWMGPVLTPAWGRR